MQAEDKNTYPLCYKVYIIHAYTQLTVPWSMIYFEVSIVSLAIKIPLASTGGQYYEVIVYH